VGEACRVHRKQRSTGDRRRGLEHGRRQARLRSQDGGPGGRAGRLVRGDRGTRRSGHQQLNDGKLFTQFTDDCDRVENGLRTTHNAPAFPNYPIAAFGCREQFEKGQYKYDDRLRHRRYPLVDEEKGLVLAGGFIDHMGKLVDFTWTDGTPAKSFYHSPHSYAYLEAFKIVDGKIAAVESIFVDVPYHMPSPWPLGEDR
jgi:hypothetical protein